MFILKKKYINYEYDSSIFKGIRKTEIAKLLNLLDEELVV
jgi:hypothetical protein